MSDSTRLPDVIALAQTLPRGWGLVIRHYDATDRTSLVKSAVEQCRRRRVFVIVAGDPDLSRRVGADGVHVPEGMIGTTAMLRSALHGRGIIAASAHGAPGLRRAALIGADAVLLSPVYATASHNDAQPLGRMRFAALVRRAGTCVYALGGMTLRDLNVMRALGAAGIAGISVVRKTEGDA